MKNTTTLKQKELKCNTKIKQRKRLKQNTCENLFVKPSSRQAKFSKSIHTIDANRKSQKNEQLLSKNHKGIK